MQHRGPVFRALDQDIIQIFKNGTLVLETTAREIKNQAPNWNGEISVGDFMVYEGKEKRILGLSVKHPDAPNIITKYKVEI